MCAPRCRRLEVALAQGLGGRAAASPGGLLGALLAGDAGPADAEVEDAGVEAETVEDLDRVVGHLLEADRTGGAVGLAQPEHEAAVVGRR